MSIVSCKNIRMHILLKIFFPYLLADRMWLRALHGSLVLLALLALVA